MFAQSSITDRYPIHMLAKDSFNFQSYDILNSKSLDMLQKLAELEQRLLDLQSGDLAEVDAAINEFTVPAKIGPNSILNEFVFSPALCIADLKDAYLVHTFRNTLEE